MLGGEVSTIGMMSLLTLLIAVIQYFDLIRIVGDISMGMAKLLVCVDLPQALSQA